MHIELQYCVNLLISAYWVLQLRISAYAICVLTAYHVYCIAWDAVGAQIEPYLVQHAEMAAPLWCGLGMPFPKQLWY